MISLQADQCLPIIVHHAKEIKNKSKHQNNFHAKAQRRQEEPNALFFEPKNQTKAEPT